jgi:hypothetical protein
MGALSTAAFHRGALIEGAILRHPLQPLRSKLSGFSSVYPLIRFALPLLTFQHAIEELHYVQAG